MRIPIANPGYINNSEKTVNAGAFIILAYTGAGMTAFTVVGRHKSVRATAYK